VLRHVQKRSAPSASSCDSYVERRTLDDDFISVLEHAFVTTRIDYCIPCLLATGGASGWSVGVRTSKLFENMGLIIRPNVHINTVEYGWGGIVLVIRQYRKSQILALLSDEKMRL